MTTRLLGALFVLCICTGQAVAERGYLTSQGYTGFMDRNIKQTFFAIDAPHIADIRITKLGARTVKGKGVLVMIGRSVKRFWTKRIVVGKRYGLVANHYAPVAGGKR